MGCFGMGTAGLAIALEIMRATEDVPLRVEKDGKQVYHPNVVLDLDYWLLMPKRP